MSKVKICGLRRNEDIDIVNQAKPDYVGFIFAPSKRQVSPQDVANLCQRLDLSIQKVGVFVNENSEHLLEMASIASLDVVQLHGDEDATYVRKVENHGFEIWKALRLQKESDITDGLQIKAERYLLDAFSEDCYGGSGKRFDFDLLKAIDRDFLQEKIIIAGGLDHDFVANLAPDFTPYAFDVSSGVETDGYKDSEKTTTFIQTIRGRK